MVTYLTQKEIFEAIAELITKLTALKEHVPENAETISHMPNRFDELISDINEKLEYLIGHTPLSEQSESELNAATDDLENNCKRPPFVGEGILMQVVRAGPLRQFLSQFDDDTQFMATIAERIV